MKKIVEWLHSYGVILLLALFLLGFIQTCNNRRQIDKAAKEVKAAQSEIDSLTTIITTGSYLLPKDELELILEINGYQISKRLLYDNNAIIRRITRPDDQLNKYDEKLDSLRKQYKKYGK